MISSRRLRADADKDFFDLAWEWRQSYPKRFHEWDALDGPDMPAWAQAENPDYIYIGIEEDGVPAALLLFRHAGSGWFEAHLDARRGFSLAQLDRVAWEWGWGLFELGAEAIYAWVLDPNRVSRKAAEALCLTYDGTLRWQGIFRGRIAKSRRHTLERSTWLNWYHAATLERIDNGETKTGSHDHSGDLHTAVRSEG